MPTLLQNKRETWSRNIAKTAAEERPLRFDGSLNPIFPWIFLRQHTDNYLRKKGGSSQDDRDARCLALVMGEEFKDVAIAAVAHAMSLASIELLFKTQLRCVTGQCNRGQLIEHLNAIVATNVTHRAFAKDAKFAAALMPYVTWSITDREARAQGLLCILLSPGVRDSMLYNHIISFARTSSRDYHAMFKQFAMNGSGVKAATSAAWLRTFTESLAEVDAKPQIEEILDEEFYSWRAWAAWRPDINRLKCWKENLDQMELVNLRDILAWDGPDFRMRLQPSMRAAIVMSASTTDSNFNHSISVTQLGDVPLASPVLVSQLWSFMDDVLMLLGQACSKNRQTYLRPLVLKLLGTPLDPINIGILQNLVALNDIDLTRAVHELFHEKPAVEELLLCLPALSEDNAEPLRRLIGPQIMSILQIALGDHQAKALSAISKINQTFDVASSQVYELSRFGSSLALVNWHHDLLHRSIAKVLKSWPTLEQCQSWLRMWQYATVRSKHTSPVTFDRIRSYFVHLFICPNDSPTTELMTTVASFFDTSKKTSYGDRRTLALWVANQVGPLDYPYYAKECLDRLASESHELVKVLSDLLINGEMTWDPIESVREFAEQLAQELPDAIKCWRPLLLRIIAAQPGHLSGYDFAVRMLNRAGVRAFTQFRRDMKAILEGEKVPDDAKLNILLDASIDRWITREIEPRLPVIQEFEDSLPASDKERTALECIVLNAGEKPDWNSTVALRRCLARLDERARIWQESATKEERVIFFILQKLARDGGNAQIVADLIDQLTVNEVTTVHGAMPAVFDCEEIISNLEHTEFASAQPELCEMLLANALQAAPSRTSLQAAVNTFKKVLPSSWVNPVGGNKDRDQYKSTLQQFGRLFDVDLLEPSWLCSDDSLEAVDQVLDEQTRAVVKEAQRLEALRLAFMQIDPHGTRIYLDGLGFEDDYSIKYMLDALPLELQDVIEQVGQYEVEMQIPLTGFTAFQKTAMGHPNARNVLIRLYLDPRDAKFPPRFCVHFDDHEGGHSERFNGATTGAHNVHTPHVVSASSSSRLTEIEYCYGRLTPMVFQISRLLANHLARGNPDLQGIHTLLIGLITPKTVFMSCLICNAPHSAASTGTVAAIHYARPTSCHLSACKDILARSPLEVSLSIIRQDWLASILLLSAVHAVTLVTKTNLQFALLPLCPSPTIEVLKMTMRTLPSINTLSAGKEDLHKAIAMGKAGDSNAKFLQWVLAGSTYKGYLVSATGQLLLPGLPAGVRQFVQAHAGAEQELAFATSLQKFNGESKPMFHGTTLDRLFSILVHGLKVKSGGQFQRNGSAFGPGIYLSDEMRTAFAYADTSTAGIVGAPWSGAGGTLGSSIRVVLGVELAGASTARSTNIHVIDDPERVIVRYVFICATGTAWPVARHITPAMESVFKSVRNGII